PRTRARARQRPARPLQLLRSARQQRRDPSLPEPGDPAMAQGATAPQPAQSPELAANASPRPTMAPASPDHASSTQPAIQRQNPSQEPSALAVHAGICAGGRPSPQGEGRSLPRPFGHVRQLDHVLDTSLARAWQAGAGPGGLPLVIDIDSFIGEVHGDQKQGASYGYTRQLGYHPILAVRADTGEA